MNKGVVDMSMGPYNPQRHFEAIRREIDRFFPDGVSSLFNKSESGIGFPLDLHETEHEIVATCSLPGIENKEDIRIEVNNNTLTVSGIVQKTNEINEDQLHRQERYYGRFQRSVPLPASVSGDGVHAKYRNGVLEIHMPKQKDEPKTRINVDFL
jgi:HSP20 family protein